MRTTVLHDVRKLVRKQMPSRFAFRPVLTAAENNIAAECVGFGVDSFCRGFSCRAGMYPDVPEVIPEARFEERSCCPIEGAAARAPGRPKPGETPAGGRWLYSAVGGLS